MALTVAELNAKLTMDAKQFDAAIKGAQRSAGDLDGKAGKSFLNLKNVAQTALGFGIAQAAASAASALVNFAHAAIAQASAVQEQINAAAVTFGEQADAIVSFSERTAQSFGLSQKEALEGANAIGAFFKAAGVSGPALAGMSKQLLALSADLASFKDIAGGAPEALERLRAGLAGETEPLRRLGIFINEATVQTKALELGLASTKAEITDGDKILARYSLSLEQTKDAQGDFARTSDSLANQQRIANASWQDLQKIVGQELLPLARQFTAWIGKEGIPRLRELAGHIETVTDAFADAGHIWGMVIDTVKPLAGTLLPALEDEAKAQHGAFRDLTGTIFDLNKVSVSYENLVEAQVTAQDQLTESTKAAAEKTQELTKAKLDQVSAERDAEKATRALSEAQDEVNELLEAGAIDAKEVAAATKELDRANREVASSAKAIERAQSDVAKATEDVQKAEQALAEARKPVSIEDLEDAQRDVAKAQIALERAGLKAGDAQTELERIQGDLTETQRTLTDAELDQRQSVIDLVEAESRLRESERQLQALQNKGANDSAAVVSAQDALKEAQDKLKSSVDGVAAAQLAAEDAAKARGEAEAALRQAEAGDPEFQRKLQDARESVTDAEIALTRAKYDAVTASQQVKKALDEERSALDDIAAAHDRLQNEQAQTLAMEAFRLSAGAGSSGNILAGATRMGASSGDILQSLTRPKFHSGGIVPGPRGADVPIMAQAGERIIPAGAGAGGVVINITVAGDTDPDGAARRIHELLRSYQRRSGSLGFT